jgi:hypothetical protein
MEILKRDIKLKGTEKEREKEREGSAVDIKQALLACGLNYLVCKKVMLKMKEPM